MRCRMGDRRRFHEDVRESRVAVEEDVVLREHNSLFIRRTDFLKIDGNFFLYLFATQTYLSFLLVTFVGPGLIAPDVANNALPLYLCRPEPLRGVSLVEVSLEELALDALSLELSLDELSVLDLSSDLSLDPESPPEEPAEVDFLA